MSFVLILLQNFLHSLIIIRFLIVLRILYFSLHFTRLMSRKTSDRYWCYLVRFIVIYLWLICYIIEILLQYHCFVLYIRFKYLLINLL